jgi:hypothetical protein
VAADRFATHHGYNLLIDGACGLRAMPMVLGRAPAPVLVFARGELAPRSSRCSSWASCRPAAYAIGEPPRAQTYAAAGAALALLLNPAFAGLSRVVMTEVPSLAFGLAGCWLYLGPAWSKAKGRGERTEARPREALLAGLLTAAGFALRSECIAMLLPFAWRVLTRGRRPASLLELLAPSALVAAATVGTTRRRSRAGSARASLLVPGAPDFPEHDVRASVCPAESRKSDDGFTHRRARWARRGRLDDRAGPRCRARRALGYFALAAVPGSLLHLVYFYPETRFHIFVLALASILGGAAPGRSPASRSAAASGRCRWFSRSRRSCRHGQALRRRCSASTRRRSRETLPDAVVVTGIDPVFLEPYLVRDASHAIVPASRSVEYASKLVAPVRIERSTRRRADRPIRGRRASCGRERSILPIVATRIREKLLGWVRKGGGSSSMRAPPRRRSEADPRPFTRRTQPAGPMAQGASHARSGADPR